MFQKKQVIYSESLGACVVDNIVPLSASRTEPAVLYYVLKCLFEDKVSYIHTGRASSGQAEGNVYG